MVDFYSIAKDVLNVAMQVKDCYDSYGSIRPKLEELTRALESLGELVRRPAPGERQASLITKNLISFINATKALLAEMRAERDGFLAKAFNIAKQFVLSKETVGKISLLQEQMFKFKSLYDTQQFALIESNTFGILEESKKTNDHLASIVDIKMRHLEIIRNEEARAFWQENFHKPPVRWTDIVLALRRAVEPSYPASEFATRFQPINERIRLLMDPDKSGDVTVLEYSVFTEDYGDLVSVFQRLWSSAGGDELQKIPRATPQTPSPSIPRHKALPTPPSKALSQPTLRQSTDSSSGTPGTAIASVTPAVTNSFDIRAAFSAAMSVVTPKKKNINAICKLVEEIPPKIYEKALQKCRASPSAVVALLYHESSDTYFIFDQVSLYWHSEGWGMSMDCKTFGSLPWSDFCEYMRPKAEWKNESDDYYFAIGYLGFKICSDLRGIIAPFFEAFHGKLAASYTSSAQPARGIQHVLPRTLANCASAHLQPPSTAAGQQLHPERVGTRLKKRFPNKDAFVYFVHQWDAEHFLAVTLDGELLCYNDRDAVPPPHFWTLSCGDFARATLVARSVDASAKAKIRHVNIQVPQGGTVVHNWVFCNSRENATAEFAVLTALQNSFRAELGLADPPASPSLDSRSCSRGHGLTLQTKACSCSRCGAKCNSKEQHWACAPCAVNVCTHCLPLHAMHTAPSSLTASQEETPSRPPSTPQPVAPVATAVGPSAKLDAAPTSTPQTPDPPLPQPQSSVQPTPSSSGHFDVRAFVIGAGVKAERHEQVIRVLQEQEVDDDALALLTDDVLRQWGIVVGADRLKLLRAASAPSKT